MILARVSKGVFPMIEPVSYIAFTSTEPFTISVYNSKKNWDGTLYYSADAVKWNEWNGATPLTSGEGNILYMRGTGNSIITNNATSADASAHWVLTGKNIRCDGNIECLLDYETVRNGEHPVMAAYCFNRMFYGNASLVKGPDLPATELSISCYRSLYNRCTSLTEVPILPATELKQYCYYFMFYECTSLKKLPVLPATTLASYCYHSMFRNCTGIKISTTPTDQYVNEYRIPFAGTGDDASNTMTYMFTATGGTFKGAPAINTTYYLHKNTYIIGLEPTVQEAANLVIHNGEVSIPLPQWDTSVYPYAIVSFLGQEWWLELFKVKPYIGPKRIGTTGLAMYGFATSQDTYSMVYRVKDGAWMLTTESSRQYADQISYCYRDQTLYSAPHIWTNVDDIEIRDGVVVRRTSEVLVVRSTYGDSANLTTSDGYALQDADGNYLIPKEG